MRSSGIKIIPLRHGVTTPPVAASLAELTTSEVTFRCAVPLRPGEVFLLLPRGDVTAEKRFEYTVTDARPAGEGEWVVVGHFARLRYQRNADAV